MNKIFLILYSGANSDSLEIAIKSYGPWFHFGNDAYLIAAPRNITSEQFRLQLESKIQVGIDRLLIMDIKINAYNGYLHDNEWEWIKNQSQQRI